MLFCNESASHRCGKTRGKKSISESWCIGDVPVFPSMHCLDVPTNAESPKINSVATFSVVTRCNVHSLIRKVVQWGKQKLHVERQLFNPITIVNVRDRTYVKPAFLLLGRNECFNLFEEGKHLLASSIGRHL